MKKVIDTSIANISVRFTSNPRSVNCRIKALFQEVYIYVTNKVEGDQIANFNDEIREDKEQKIKIFANNVNKAMRPDANREVKVIDSPKNTFRNVLNVVDPDGNPETVVRNYIKGLVSSDPLPASYDYDNLFVGGGRSQVLVVGGESGSGKTVYATHTVAPDAHRLYVVMPEKIHPEFLGKNREEIKRWKSALRAVSLYSKEEDGKLLFKYLDRAYTALNKGRNEWAQEILLDMVRNMKTSDGRNDENAGPMWFLREGGFGDVELDKFILVIDECGHHTDFVDAMIDSGNRFLDFQLEGLVKSCGLVLCGTTLEMLKKQDLSVGSNPNKSFVTVMQRPDPKALVASLSKSKPSFRVTPDALSAKGSFASILATNARILTKALIPFFNSFYGSHGGALENDPNQLKKIQIELGSHWFALSFALSAFIRYNNMANLDFDEREKLLQMSFRYLVCQGMGEEETEKKYNTDLLKQIRDQEERDRNDDLYSKMFQYGIVARDPVFTSPALKLIALEGIANPIIPTDGSKSLERAIALLLCRHLQVCGYLVDDTIYTLRGAWPPQMSDDNEATQWTKDLESGHDEDLKKLKSFIESQSTTKEAIVLVQGVDNAQGPDIMVLRDECSLPSTTESTANAVNTNGRSDESEQHSATGMDGSASQDHRVLKLDVYQTKHFKMSHQITAEMVSTLGVLGKTNCEATDVNIEEEEKLEKEESRKKEQERKEEEKAASAEEIEHLRKLNEKTRKDEERQRANRESVRKSAKYSHDVIDRFCKKLSTDHVGVECGDRVLVLPLGVKSENWKDGAAQVWTKDYLEPAYSIFENLHS